MSPLMAPQWREVEIELRGPEGVDGYLDVDAWVSFIHTSGHTIRRPVFWDGDRTYRVRFASSERASTWRWRVDIGTDLQPSAGQLDATPPDTSAAHPCLQHGLLSVPPGSRTLHYADGMSTFLVADTAWALPFRATLDDVTTYAQDRNAKHFNAVFLMMVMPDMDATGPQGRNTDGGFEVAFRDLPNGHLNEINIDYFQYFDAISQILVDHAITPVLQPVFHGFGWKGQNVAGPHIEPTEYARFCRYLVARYGARPAIYLVCGDGSGEEPPVLAAGLEIDRSDDYGQPVGIHYRPHALNRAHQDASWLDFQSCQTGHDGDHAPDRLATMWANRPTKAIMNGEPTYENSGRRGKATGWWQGNEAWINVCAGGLFGIGYGAASLWQWSLHRNEEGHPPFYLAEDVGWREALAFEGSRYVGLVGRILDGLPLERAAPCWDVCQRTRGLLVPGELYLGYAEHGGQWTFLDADGRIPDEYWLIDPRTAMVIDHGIRPGNFGVIPGEDEVPCVLICARAEPAIARTEDR